MIKGRYLGPAETTADNLTCHVLPVVIVNNFKERPKGEHLIPQKRKGGDKSPESFDRVVSLSDNQGKMNSMKSSKNLSAFGCFQ